MWDRHSGYPATRMRRIPFVILTGLCFRRRARKWAAEWSSPAPAGSRRNQSQVESTSKGEDGEVDSSQKRLHNGAVDGLPEEPWAVDETGPGTREEAYHARQSGTNASSRWTANASKNPDGLVQCTFLGYHR